MQLPAKGAASVLCLPSDIFYICVAHLTSPCSDSEGLENEWLIALGGWKDIFLPASSA